MSDSPSLNVAMAALSDAGRVRTSNQDAVFVDPARGLALLADGMGGHRGGEVAAAMAISGMAASLNLLPSEGAAECLVSAIRQTNQAIYQRARSESACQGMGTTLVALWVGDRAAHLAHVGDSRAYRWRDGELLGLTRDHTIVQAQVDAGLLTPALARTSTLRHLLTRALGTDPELVADLARCEVKVGDVFLLCSDGVTDLLDDDDLERMLNDLADPAEAAAALIALANGRGGHDNVSVIVVRVGDGP